MDTAQLRSQLHDYIERADERHLEAMYMLLEPAATQSALVYDEATIEMLHQRRNAHLNGESKSYTAAESLDLIRQSKK